MKNSTKRKIGLANKGKKHKKIKVKQIKCLCYFPLFMQISNETRSPHKPCTGDNCFCPLHYGTGAEWEKAMINKLRKIANS